MNQAPRKLIPKFVLPVFTLLAVTIFCFYCAVIHYHVNTDAGAYLRAARHLSNGHVLYKDISCGYTPLGILTLSAILKTCTGDLQYQCVVGFLLLLGVVASFILFRASSLAIHDASFRIFISLVYFCGCLCFGGAHIFLEQFVVVFSLCATFNLFRNTSYLSIAASGVLCGCAFLSKQYGLTALPSSLFALLVLLPGWSPRLKGSVILVSSCVLSICAASFLFSLLFGFSLSSVHSGLSGNYYTRFGIDERSISLILTLVIPALISLPYRFSLDRGSKVASLIDTCWVALALNLLPFFVRHYNHYALLSLPYSIMLVGMGNWWILEHKRPLIRRWSLVALVPLLVTYPLSSMFLSVEEFQMQSRSQQFALAKKFDSHFEVPVRAVVFGPEYLCYLSDKIEDPAMNYILGIGCGFYRGARTHSLLDLLARADAVTVSSSYQLDWLSDEDQRTILVTIERDFSLRITLAEDVALYRRRDID